MIKKTILIVLLSIGLSSAKGIIVDRSLAVVNSEVITLSTLTVYYQLLKLQKLTKKPIDLKKLPFKMSKQDLKKTLESYIILELINQERSKVNSENKPAPQAMKMLINCFKNNDDFNKFLEIINSNSKSISKLISRQQASQEFIRDKINKDSIIVTTEELHNLLKELKLEKTTKNSNRIKKLIVKSKYEKRISSFMTKLLERNRIKYLIER